MEPWRIDKRGALGVSPSLHGQLLCFSGRCEGMWDSSAESALVRAYSGQKSAETGANQDALTTGLSLDLLRVIAGDSSSLSTIDPSVGNAQPLGVPMR